MTLLKLDILLNMAENAQKQFSQLSHVQHFKDKSESFFALHKLLKGQQLIFKVLQQAFSRSVLTQRSTGRLVVKGINGQRQTVNVEEGSLIQRPLQPVGDVHL